jgi:hypothetical protein
MRKATGSSRPRVEYVKTGTQAVIFEKEDLLEIRCTYL